MCPDLSSPSVLGCLELNSTRAIDIRQYDFAALNPPRRRSAEGGGESTGPVDWMNWMMDCRWKEELTAVCGGERAVRLLRLCLWEKDYQL